MSSSPLRVLLADANLLVRDGLRCLLARAEHLEVVGVAADPEAALQAAERLRPDVLLLDQGLAGPEPRGLLIDLGARTPGLAVVMLVSGTASRPALTALRAGVLGLVHVTDGPGDLEAALRAAGQRQRWVSPSLAGLLARRLDADEEADEVLERLSERERELLRHISSGLTLREASRIMAISESTASTYRQRLLRKLRVTTTAQRIRFALVHGLAG